MQLRVRESIDKTKLVFNKTLQNLKSFFSGGYRKLHRSASCNPFSSCSSCSFKSHLADQYYKDFCNEWEFDLEKKMENKKSCGATVAKEAGEEEEEEEGCNESSMKLQKSPLKKKEEVIKEVKCKKSCSSSRKLEEQFSKNKIEGGYALAKKMKDLEMMDVSDVEHVLDVEEALHYYNRLRSPVYLDIVDQFFTDMYREFSVPQASSASITSSKRRLGSIRL